jgi:hypothetical protein
MRKIFVILTIICSTIIVTQAQVNKVPATKKPIEYKQPDGTILTIILKGDEKIHWAETIDGYTLLSNKSGGYEYAKLDKHKNLVKSGKLAHQADKRTKKELRFLKKIPKGICFSEAQIEKSKERILIKQQ